MCARRNFSSSSLWLSGVRIQKKKNCVPLNHKNWPCSFFFHSSNLKQPIMQNKLTAACITVQFQFGEYWIIIFMTLSCRVVVAVKTERRLATRLPFFLALTHASSRLEVHWSDCPIAYALIVIIRRFGSENESQETHSFTSVFRRKSGKDS